MMMTIKMMMLTMITIMLMMMRSRSPQCTLKKAHPGKFGMKTGLEARWTSGSPSPVLNLRHHHDVLIILLIYILIILFSFLLLYYLFYYPSVIRVQKVICVTPGHQSKK